ncbi:hypothetical protein CC78DRAFT_7297 [Lojkania enalia]|uniref:Uncharacterized protein n=1 Tax=Lojkania enalia TaxID=147567 RepID=A0A9P4NCW5_9PLEO|nr:hypothetical protein CC78DRAFT_7297 [Didymosphaeria enalia]
MARPALLHVPNVKCLFWSSLPAAVEPTQRKIRRPQQIQVECDQRMRSADWLAPAGPSMALQPPQRPRARSRDGLISSTANPCPSPVNPERIGSSPGLHRSADALLDSGTFSPCRCEQPWMMGYDDEACSGDQGLRIRPPAQAIGRPVQRLET